MLRKNWATTSNHDRENVTKCKREKLPKVKKTAI